MVVMATVFRGYVLCAVHAVGKETHFIIVTVFTVRTVEDEETVQQ